MSAVVCLCIASFAGRKIKGAFYGVSLQGGLLFSAPSTFFGGGGGEYARLSEEQQLAVFHYVRMYNYWKGKMTKWAGGTLWRTLRR